MKQSSLGLGQSSKSTRRRVFFEETDRVVPWAEWVALITACVSEGQSGPPPFAVEAILHYRYPNSNARAAELEPWMHHYNWRRPHSATEHSPPTSRFGARGNNVSGNYT